jgi:hypothetical protein
MNMSPLANIIMFIPAVLTFAFYGFILWLFYRMVIAVEKIGERVTEITDLLRSGAWWSRPQRNPASPDQPPLPPAASQ